MTTLVVETPEEAGLPDTPEVRAALERGARTAAHAYELLPPDFWRAVKAILEREGLPENPEPYHSYAFVVSADLLPMDCRYPCDVLGYPLEIDQHRRGRGVQLMRAYRYEPIA